MAALRPLPVDPEIRVRIRPMAPADVADVARLHGAAMGESLWARLGPGYLRTLYRALLGSSHFVGHVYVEDGRVRGFIAGTDDGPAMMRDVATGAGLRVGLAALAGAARRPAVLGRLAQTGAYLERSELPELAGVRAESMFCSFEPGLRGKRISGLINKVLFDELAARGHRFVKITTDEGNAGARRQLESWGFDEVGRFDFYGKPMTAWRLDLLHCARVDHPDVERA